MAVLSQQIIRESVARKRETARVWMVRIIFVLYWLLIFTGALRKWGFPQLQKPLFFIAVPFTLLLYGISLKYNMWPRGRALLQFAYILATAALILVPVQMIIGHYALRYGILAAYGWLNYFFYVPLTFIIAKEFNQGDVRRLLRHTLWIGIMSAPLVALQFISSPDSLINSGYARTAVDQFHDLGAPLGHIRPAGFFSNSIGLGLFLGTLTIAVLYGWITSAQDAITRRWILAAATMSLFLMLAFSGSRGAMAQCGIVFVGTAIAGLITNRRQLAIRAGMWPLLLVTFLFVLWPIVLPNAFDAFIMRWTGAEAGSPFALGFLGRALYSLYGWIYYLNVPFFGFLLGIATDAASRISWVQMPAAAHAWNGYGGWATESGFSTSLVDLGLVVGAGYILFRIWFTLWLLTQVWKSTKKNRDPLALMLFSFSGEMILMGSITVQGTVNGYAWIFLGVTLAAAKFATTENDSACVPARLER
jgi:hypothetical protein